MTSFFRTRLAALAAAAAFAGPAHAQAQPAPAEKFAVETATPAMWRVTDADSDYVLVGTFHILPPGLDWRTDALEAAFDAADAVYFELDAEAPDTGPKTLNTVMTKGFNPPGTTLLGMLGEADAQKLKEVTASVNLPFAAIDTMRPWNAFLTLSVQFIVNQGFDPGAGVDSVLLKEAKMRKKNVRFFETIEEQLALFTGLDSETEMNLLLLTLADWDKQAELFDDLFRAWATGDTDFIDAQMNDDMREQTPVVYERLIVARNKMWAEELDAALKNESGKGFVAVGAAHLVGADYSVPALLEAKGYEVTRYGESAAAPEAANDNAPVE
jgi:hypothetical protein